MTTAPLQAAAIRGRDAAVTPGDKQSHHIKGPWAELLLEQRRLFLIVKQPEPVNKLTYAVFEAGRPLGDTTPTSDEHAG